MQNFFHAAPRILTPAIQAYDRRFKRCGPTAQGVFWQNKNRQLRRYEILENIFDETAKEGGITIHDFGCGYGALFQYLSRRPVMANSRYIGTDMCLSMIKAAKDQPLDPRATFIHDVVAREVTDYTIVSGTFNLHINADPDAWRKYVQASLIQLWLHTRRGLAFNMLSRDTERKYDGLYYTEPNVFMSFARKNLSPDSEITLDPILPDFTIFVRRP